MKSLQTPLDQLGLWRSRHSRATVAALFLLAGTQTQMACSNELVTGRRAFGGKGLWGLVRK